jgi:hypothetical protein
MNTPTQNPNTNPSTSPPTYHEWREQRRAERWARREARWQRHAGWPYGWFGGLVLILIGAAFLLENLGISYLTNWWALFILIPAFGIFLAAWENYQDNGRLTRGGVATLTVGSLLTIVALALLLNLNVGLFWPILLIAGGLVLILTASFPE